MLNLRRLVIDVSAAVLVGRLSAFIADDQREWDDTSTRNNAGHGSCQALERCVFSVGDATSLAILAQCVP
jgi:hypothetical protein